MPGLLAHGRHLLYTPIPRAHATQVLLATYQELLLKLLLLRLAALVEGNPLLQGVDEPRRATSNAQHRRAEH